MDEYSPLEYTKLLLEEEINKVNIGVGVIRRQQEEIKVFKVKVAELSVANQKILDLEKEVATIKELYDRLESEHHSLLRYSNQIDDVHKVEINAVEGVVSVLKGQLEQRALENTKLENIISATVNEPDIINIKEELIDKMQIKDFIAIKKKYDLTKDKINSLLKLNSEGGTNGNNNHINKNNNDIMKKLVSELNEITEQMLDLLLSQVSEERKYSNDLLKKFNEELLSSDLLIDMVNNLSQQSSYSNTNIDEKRVSLSFVLPDTHSQLFNPPLK